MKTALLTLLLVFSGLSHAASDVYTPNNGMLVIPTLNVASIGDFCDVRIQLGNNGSWNLLSATACMPLVPPSDFYDPVDEILVLPRLTVYGGGDLCSVLARLSLDTWRWDLLSFSQCPR